MKLTCQTQMTAGCSSVVRGAIGGDLDQVLLVTDDFVGAIFLWVQYWMDFGHLGLVLKLNFVYCNGSDEPVEKRRQWVQNNGDGRLRLGPDPLQSHCGRLMNILQGWAKKSRIFSPPPSSAFTVLPQRGMIEGGEIGNSLPRKTF